LALLPQVQTPEQHSASATHDPVSFVVAAQVPLAHVVQAPVQALSQQMPSTQWVDWHSPPVAHLAALGFLDGGDGGVATQRPW
jgi:hypothetical protein